MTLYKDRTSIQADKLALTYICKVIRIFSTEFQIYDNHEVLYVRTTKNKFAEIFTSYYSNYFNLKVIFK